jgi:hypothetical protein
MPLAISNSGTGGFSGNSGSISISANAGDFVVFMIGMTASLVAPSVASISTVAGLSAWTKRTAVPNWASGGQNGLEEWFATASSAIVAQSITVNINGSLAPAADIGYVAISSGKAFDLNGGVPSDQSGRSGNPPTGTMSTSNPDAVLLGGLSSASATVAGKSPTGWTDLGLGPNSILDTVYLITSTPQVGASVAWQTGAVSVGNWGMILDAVDPPISYNVLGLASSEW